MVKSYTEDDYTKDDVLRVKITFFKLNLKQL